MKSEQRHKLETNTLADGLARATEKLRPYASSLLTAAAVVLAGYLLLTMWRNSGSRQERMAWDEYQMALLGGDIDMKQLQRVAASEDYSGSAMQEWAYMGWADRQLRLAAERYLTDRDDAQKRLKTIAAIYDQFATSATDPDVKNRARLGLARVSEMQNHVEDARKQYALVEGALAPLAAARIEALESKDAQATCEWLATAELPKPRADSGAGGAGSRPGFDAAAPAADASPADANATRSLEDILGGLNAGADANRYGETPAEEPQTPADPAAQDAAEAPASDAAPAEPAAPAGDAAPAAATGPEQDAAPANQ